MDSYFRSQYDLVRQSRNVLLNYCEKINEKDFLSENNLFGRGGSMRNLLIHIVNTYEYWIIQHALKRSIVFTAYASSNSVVEVRASFNAIDTSVFDFIRKFETSAFAPMVLEISGGKRTQTAFELFTHVITHEFHHKGQVLSLSRQLGYVPVDTDIIR